MESGESRQGCVASVYAVSEQYSVGEVQTRTHGNRKPQTEEPGVFTAQERDNGSETVCAVSSVLINELFQEVTERKFRESRSKRVIRQSNTNDTDVRNANTDDKSSTSRRGMRRVGVTANQREHVVFM